MCVTGAAGAVGYSFLPLLASGNVFGNEIKIRLRLMDKKENDENLKGVACEIEDSCYPLLEGIRIGSNPEKMFKDCDLIVFIGGSCRQPGQSRQDLPDNNGPIFQEQGKALNKVGNSKTRCLVVANPPNTNAFILAKNAPNVPKENITTLTRLDHNRALAQLSMKLNKPVSDIQNIIVWGNHSENIYPDIYNARCDGKQIGSLIFDDNFINMEFVKAV